MPIKLDTVWSNLVHEGAAVVSFVSRRFGRGEGEGAVVQKGALKVDAVDFLPKQNAGTHNTKRFEMIHREPRRAILRRGEPFTITIRFNRVYSPPNDVLRLIFDFGSNPLVIKGTKGIITINQTTEECWPDRSGIWDSRIEPSETELLTIEIRSPTDIPVGEWTFNVETMTKDGEGAPVVYTHPDTIFILFNPWLKEDTVYMEDQKLVDEYVLNDVGKIWVGAHRQARGRHWVFGQFDRNVLPAALLMLERAKLVPINYGNPIIVSRAISKLVNSNDDLGIIAGKWNGEYEDGIAPSAWTGSVEILKQYLKTKQEVKYGQCWVFAGVTTTICRALGIPSRVVSNLVSAHDANASFSIDKYYTATGDELSNDPNNESGSEDSIWNFHVWNEVWMARPDLPKGYGGWQAIDATPQETSDGVFQCGPASLEAIKKGVVAYKYDVPFVLSSVNADLIRWIEDPTSSFGYRKMDTNTMHVGRQILTKSPFLFDPRGDADIQDITRSYKEKEGTQMERTTMYNAARNLVSAKKLFFQPGESEEELSFTLEDVERIPIGHNFNIVVNIKNNLDKERKMDVVLSASSVYYNGINAHLVKKASGTFHIKPNSKEQLRLVVTPDEYLEKLVEYCIMKLFAVITVVDSKQTWAGEDDFQILKPPLDVKVPEKVYVGQPATITFSFTNPLNKPLQKCKLRFESSPVVTKVVVMDYKNVDALEEVNVEGTVTPKKPGTYRIVAAFSSLELIDITGAANVEVLPAQ